MMVNRFRHLSDEGTTLCHARLEPIVTIFAQHNQEHDKYLHLCFKS